MAYLLNSISLKRYVRHLICSTCAPLVHLAAMDKAMVMETIGLPWKTRSNLQSLAAPVSSASVSATTHLKKQWRRSLQQCKGCPSSPIDA